MTETQTDVKLHIESIINRALTETEITKLLHDNSLADTMLLTYDDAEELKQVLEIK